MRADLHIHTVFSDGSHTPREVARMAKENGVRLISLTDHDTMGDLAEKRAAAEEEGLFFVSGWELSAYTASARVHVLGYNCRAGAEYAAFCGARREAAKERALDMIAKANSILGTFVTLSDCERQKKVSGAPFHTMHVVRAFAEAVGRDGNELYGELFDLGKPAHSAIGRPTPFEAVRIIHACGGISSLAHPARIGLAEEERDALIDALAEAGLDGIECFHSQHTEGEKEYYSKLAKKRGLLITGGSDFHAEGRDRTVGQPFFDADERLLSALGLRV